MRICETEFKSNLPTYCREHRVARLALCQLVRPTSSPALKVHPARWGLQLSHWQLATRRCPLGGFHLEEIGLVYELVVSGI